MPVKVYFVKEPCLLWIGSNDNSLILTLYYKVYISECFRYHELTNCINILGTLLEGIVHPKILTLLNPS